MKERGKSERKRRTTEEMMLMIRCSDELRPQNITEPINTTTFPTWKLYENPFYYYSPQQHHHHHRRRHLPLSAHKIAASLWDLSFFRQTMDSELDIARAQIIELKAELEFERKVRKKVEFINKRLAKEISEERKEREAMERVCDMLAKEIASNKAVISRMKREMEEERKMLRMAEVLREERVQMKLSEAKILLEEKLTTLEFSKGVIHAEESKTKNEGSLGITNINSTSIATTNDHNPAIGKTINHRRASPEAENPHIKRGIKGFVEFPRVVRVIGSRGRHLGMKLECQKAQLRILLRQKNPI